MERCFATDVLVAKAHMRLTTALATGSAVVGRPTARSRWWRNSQCGASETSCLHATHEADNTATSPTGLNQRGIPTVYLEIFLRANSMAASSGMPTGVPLSSCACLSALRGNVSQLSAMQCTVRWLARIDLFQPQPTWQSQAKAYRVDRPESDPLALRRCCTTMQPSRDFTCRNSPECPPAVGLIRWHFAGAHLDRRMSRHCAVCQHAQYGRLRACNIGFVGVVPHVFHPSQQSSAKTSVSLLFPLQNSAQSSAAGETAVSLSQTPCPKDLQQGR
jgi:hypothetical protein